VDNSCFLDAGKVSRLLPLLEEYKRENKRVLIFSQVSVKSSKRRAIQSNLLLLVHSDYRYLTVDIHTSVDQASGLDWSDARKRTAKPSGYVYGGREHLRLSSIHESW
jgi:hypothetical protein